MRYQENFTECKTYRFTANPENKQTNKQKTKRNIVCWTSSVGRNNLQDGRLCLILGYVTEYFFQMLQVNLHIRCNIFQLKAMFLIGRLHVFLFLFSVILFIYSISSSFPE